MNEADRLVDDFIKTYPITRYGKGQPIFRPAEEVTKVHYLLEGTVIQYDISEAGNVVIVNTFQPGAFFPLSNVITDSSLEYFFGADSPVSTRVAPREQVVEFIAENPKVVHDLLIKSYKGSDEIIKRTSYLMGGSATSRAVFELLSAAERIGEQAIDGVVFVALSENDIAKRTGLSRETVNRMFRDLKASQTIRATNQGIEIFSIEILRKSLAR